MYGNMNQMTIYDLMGEIDPLREVAKKANVHWQDSRETIRDWYRKLVQDEQFAQKFSLVVKHQYIPYGAHGHYGGGGKPNTICEYDMRNEGIKIGYYDLDGERKERHYSWIDFAKMIADLIEAGGYCGG